MSYHGNMKKMSFLLALLFLLTSCNQQTYSSKEVTGFEVSNITQMQVSSNVYQSLAWIVDEKYYSYLDCSYILVSFDINEQFMGCPQLDKVANISSKWSIVSFLDILTKRK